MVTGNEDFYFLKLANTFAENWSEYKCVERARVSQKKKACQYVKKKKHYVILTFKMFFEYKAESEADFPNLWVELSVNL